jgi:hypothetical protein
VRTGVQWVSGINQFKNTWLPPPPLLQGQRPELSETGRGRFSLPWSHEVNQVMPPADRGG